MGILQKSLLHEALEIVTCHWGGSVSKGNGTISKQTFRVVLYLSQKTLQVWLRILWCWVLSDVSCVKYYWVLNDVEWSWVLRYLESWVTLSIEWCWVLLSFEWCWVFSNIEFWVRLSEVNVELSWVFSDVESCWVWLILNVEWYSVMLSVSEVVFSVMLSV